MRVIEQEVFLEIDIEQKNYSKPYKHLQISQGDDCLYVDKQGAKQLIEVLKEFVDD